MNSDKKMNEILDEMELYLSAVKKENARVTETIDRLVEFMNPNTESKKIRFTLPISFAPKEKDRPTIRISMI